MKISVIIPTYKPQTYLWECLDSVAAQTFNKALYEVILVLNGCKEPFESEIRTYMDMHPDLHIVLIQIDSGGVSNARNLALDVARGEYITFIDDDDYVSPSYLEELYEKASPDTISLSYPYAFNDGKRDVQLNYRITSTYDCMYVEGRQRYLRSRKYFSGPWMKLIPTIYISDRRFDVRFKNGEDNLFMFLISDKFRYVDYASKNAVYYRRIRQNSAMTTNRPIKDRLTNPLRIIREYIRIYRMGNYDTCFFATRILAEIKSILLTLIK